MAKSQIPTLEEVFQPFFAYTKLATEAAEKAAKIQFDSAKIYTKIGMENISEGLKVTDLGQMSKYLEKQKDVVKETGEQYMTDAKSYAEIGATFFENSKILAEDTAKSSFDIVKQATETATKAAAKAVK